MKKREMTLTLSLCLLLTACGGQADNGGGQSSFLEKESGQTVEILLTVDGREVPVWKYEYWLTRACARMQEAYQEAGVELDWNAQISGKTLAEEVKEQALADTVLYATVENWAEKYGCTVPGAPPRRHLSEQGLSPAQQAELEAVGGLYAALYELYRTEGSPLHPEEEDWTAFAEEQGVVAVERILFAAGEDREGARRRAEEAFSKLNGAADQAEVFSMLAAAADDPASARTLWPGEDTLAVELVEAARALQEGQCSGILETEEGVSILRRTAVPAEAVEEAYFDHLLQRGAESAVITVSQVYYALDVAKIASGGQKTAEEANRMEKGL